MAPAIGHPYYEVSSHGRVRSIGRVVRRRGPDGSVVLARRASKVLSGVRMYRENGTPNNVMVHLGHDGKKSHPLVHRLVLEAFVGPCPPGMEGCHGDGNPFNNRLDNLRWDTHTANMADAKRHGTSSFGVARGSACVTAKLSESDVRQIRLRLRAGARKSVLAREFRISYTALCAVASGASWAHVK